jgi:hypothetical protein
MSSSTMRPSTHLAPTLILLLLANCASPDAAFQLKRTRLAHGERIALRTSAKDRVQVTPGLGGESEPVAVANGKVAWDWPKDPGLFLLQLEAGEQTTHLLLRVTARGELRDVDIVAQMTVPTQSAADRELWQTFVSGMLDDDVRKQLDLRMPAWFGATTQEQLRFAFAISETWQPFALTFGPGASWLTPSTLWSLYDELIDVADGFESMASGTEIGLVSQEDGRRLRQLARRITAVVDVDAAVRGLPRDVTGRLPSGPGQADLAVLVNWAREVVVARDFPFAVEECGDDERLRSLRLVRAAGR